MRSAQDSSQILLSKGVKYRCKICIIVSGSPQGKSPSEKASPQQNCGETPQQTTAKGKTLEVKRLYDPSLKLSWTYTVISIALDIEKPNSIQ